MTKEADKIKTDLEFRIDVCQAFPNLHEEFVSYTWEHNSLVRRSFVDFNAFRTYAIARLRHLAPLPIDSATIH